VWLERATKLRQLMSQMYDVIDKQLIEGAAYENRVTANGHPSGSSFYA